MIEAMTRSIAIVGCSKELEEKMNHLKCEGR